MYHDVISLFLRRHIIAGSGKGKLNLVDLRKSGTMLNTYKGFTGGVTGVTCSTTNPYVASVSLDRHLRVHDINTKKLLKCVRVLLFSLPKYYGAQSECLIRILFYIADLLNIEIIGFNNEVGYHYRNRMRGWNRNLIYFNIYSLLKIMQVYTNKKYFRQSLKDVILQEFPLIPYAFL